jgi:catechol 2,3-dioxygenase-like lactoylglutathione lyase family enzyme
MQSAIPETVTVENNKPLTKDTLHHVAVAVKDIAQAVEWYTKTFNCSVDYQDESWALLGFQNVQLALVIPSQHPPHFCVSRDDAEQFGKLKKHRDGTSSVYVRDPFGNAVEVLKEDPKF